MPNLTFTVPKRFLVILPIIDAGSDFNLLINKNGRAWSWGLASSGQLGDNTGSAKVTPVSVVGAIKTFCKISGGDLHSLAIDKNGRVWGWGSNGNGQLGDNSVTQKNTPVSILGAVKTFCQISGGQNFSLAIDKNGRAWAWGFNTSGQLGDNTILSKRTPVSVLGATKTFCKISAGWVHSLAIDKNGRAWAWGINTSGELGDNTIISKRTPISVLGATKTFCQISGGNGHSLVIDKNGRAWAWGLNSTGQLGDNSVTQRNTPVSVLGAVKTFCQISGGGSHSLAIDKNGRAWAWGLNSIGQLGDNSVTQRNTPVSVLGAVKTFCQISAGSAHSLAIDKNGRAWAWGLNTSGQLGNNNVFSRITPVSVLGAVKTFCQIAAGRIGFSLGIDKNGRAWAWGNNFNSQLGDNTSLNKYTPISVLGTVKTFCQISGGNNHTMAIDKNGRAWGWGFNGSGALGDNTITLRRTPVSVLGAVKTFCKISGGPDVSVAIDKNGRAWAWGSNTVGQLGDNTIISKRTPVSVLGAVKTFCKISVGVSAFSLAIDKNGRVWAWGFNNFGQLGDNSTTSRLTPVSILGAVKTFCEISGGSGFSLSIDKNGRVWAWGQNASGQLGDNSVTQRNTPVSILGTVKTFCQISGGSSHSLAIDKNGRAWAWGLNTSGQLGNNSTTASVRTPVSVAGTVKTFCQISGGDSHSIAIDKNGRMWAWGLRTSGQLGDNYLLSVRTPVMVCNI